MQRSSVCAYICVVSPVCSNGPSSPSPHSFLTFPSARCRCRFGVKDEGEGLAWPALGFSGRPADIIIISPSLLSLAQVDRSKNVKVSRRLFKYVKNDFRVCQLKHIHDGYTQHYYYYCLLLFCRLKVLSRMLSQDGHSDEIA